MQKLMTKQQFWYILLTAGIRLATGICFAAKPDILIHICLIAGIIMCVLGIFLSVTYLMSKRQYGSQLLYGLCFLVGGVLLCTIPTLLKFLIPIFFGLWIIFTSVSGMYRNFVLRKTHSLWLAGFILCTLGAITGFYVLTRPAYVMDTTIRLIGICLIVVGAIRFISVMLARQYFGTPEGEVIETTLKED